LLFERRDGHAFVGFGKDLAQEALELVDGGIEPLGCLLQSVCLTHRAPPPRSGAVFQPLKLLDPRINVNVVTAQLMFNNREPR
jgi:hypothetical protein